MTHRVIQFNSTVVDASTADDLQSEIQSHIDGESYDIHDSQINDGTNPDGDPTLAIKTDHNVDSEANAFFDWIKYLVKNNESDFESARLRIHDCQHLEGLNAPCEIGNAWEL